MDKKDYWEAFESTGKISDYLNFKDGIEKEAFFFGNNGNDRTDNKGTEGFGI